jgi:hypothetical protein
MTLEAITPEDEGMASGEEDRGIAIGGFVVGARAAKAESSSYNDEAGVSFTDSVSVRESC